MISIQHIINITELSEWGRLQLLCDLQYLESVSDSLGKHNYFSSSLSDSHLPIFEN